MNYETKHYYNVYRIICKHCIIFSIRVCNATITFKIIYVNNMLLCVKKRLTFVWVLLLNCMFKYRKKLSFFIDTFRLVHSYVKIAVESFFS